MRWAQIQTGPGAYFPVDHSRTHAKPVHLRVLLRGPGLALGLVLGCRPCPNLLGLAALAAAASRSLLRGLRFQV